MPFLKMMSNTTTIAYLDCFSGISGNMVLGALLDAGLPVELLKQQLDLLGLSGIALGIEPSKKGAIQGIHVTVECDDHQPPFLPSAVF